MSLFGGKDKKKQPEAVVPAEEPKKVPATLEDNPRSALPQRSSYFDALRTDAFMNHNVVENFIEFWAALKVDDQNDKWRVMHYMLYDLNMKDGKFVSEAVTKHDVGFPEAVAELAKQDYIATKMATHKETDLGALYPADRYPELKVHYFDIMPYKRGSEIEGITFDDQNKPHRRVEGRVIDTATFRRADVVKSILAVEQARNVPAVEAKIEGGILSDIFASASDRSVSLDNILKIGQVLSSMDEFAQQVGAFYLSIQRALGRDEKFDRIEGLQPEEKKEVLARSEELTPVTAGDKKAFPKILETIIPEMNRRLDECKGQGVHVEPFQKFTAECELYANLLYASQNLSKLEKGFVSVNNSDASLITQIRESADRAQKKFFDLGGTQEQMDKLKSWIANPKKDPVPGWLPGFLTRYYTARGNVMKKVQDRQAGVTQVNIMSTEVKPPLSESYNDATQAGSKPVAQPAAVQDDTPAAPGTGTQGPDFDKFKNIMGGGNRPKPSSP